MRGRYYSSRGWPLRAPCSPAIRHRPTDRQGPLPRLSTSDVYTDCGFPAQDSFDVSGNFVFNQRGSSPFPYYRESVRRTGVTTNLDTGGTYTNVFTSNGRDHKIVDNGDGTITVFLPRLRRPSRAGMTATATWSSSTAAPSASPSTSTTRAPQATQTTTQEVPDSFRIIRDFHRGQRHPGPRLLRGPGGVHQLGAP